MTGWKGPLLVLILTALATATGAIFAAPHVIMNVAIDRMIARTSVNTFTHPPLTTFETQTIVRPSPDLAYSACPFDLTAGPLRIDVVPAPGRYSSLSIFDARTDVIFVRNDVQARGQPYAITLALPQQTVTGGGEVVRTNYPRGIALIRLLLKDPGEAAALDGVRRQSQCRTIAPARAK